jgi:hypothetical protein
VSLDPQTAHDAAQVAQVTQSSWVQWVLAIGSVVTMAFSGMIGLFVSFGREAHRIYREKVDKLEEKQATFAATYITRKEVLDELARRFDDMDVRRLQMHNHNAALLEGIDTRMGGIDKRIGELRQDIKDVHKRIDEVKR